MLKFSKIRQVKSIERGTKGSAGIDFYVPEATVSYIHDFEERNPEIKYSKDLKGVTSFTVPAHKSVMIPSGIKVNIPEGKALIGFNKSGVAFKLGLVLGAKVVDSDYFGEIFIHLINTKNESVSFSENQKIAQFLLIDAWHGIPEEVVLEKLYDRASERGEGCLGSTNKEVIHEC